jgi:hypothetical protein
MERPPTGSGASGPNLALAAHVAELRGAVDQQIQLAAPRIRALRRYDEQTVDALVARYMQGAGSPTLAVDFNMPVRTVQYQLRRRGIELRPSSVPYKHPAPGEQVCALEGLRREVHADRLSGRTRLGTLLLADMRARGLARRGPGAADVSLQALQQGLYAMAERGCAAGPWPVLFTRAPAAAPLASRQGCGRRELRRSAQRARALGQQSSEEMGQCMGRSRRRRADLAEKDETNLRNAAGVALDCYRRNPNVARRDVVTLVVVALEGRDVLFDQQGTRRWARDPVRRAAEKRAIRRLEAAAKLADFADTLIARDFG